MRRLPVLSGVLAAAALSVAACGGTPAASSLPTIPAINVPTLPPINVPTIPPINVPTIPPLGSFTIPSFAIPSFAGDAALVAKFPTTINGQTVSHPESALYAEIFAAFGGQEEAAQFAQAMAAIGANPATVSYATADVTLNEDETITAVRTPGVDASNFINQLPALTVLLQPDQTPPTIGQASIGGKNIVTLTDDSGDVSYFYASGDTLWETDATDAADQAAIFGALQ